VLCVFTGAERAVALKGKNAFVSVSCFTSGQSWSEVLKRSRASLCVMLFTPILIFEEKLECVLGQISFFNYKTITFGCLGHEFSISWNVWGCRKPLCLKGVCAMHTVTCVGVHVG